MLSAAADICDGYITCTGIQRKDKWHHKLRYASHSFCKPMRTGINFNYQLYDRYSPDCYTKQ